MVAYIHLTILSIAKNIKISGDPVPCSKRGKTMSHQDQEVMTRSTDLPSRRIKVGLVSEGGGHYAQMQLLKEAFADFDYFYITIDNLVTRDGVNTYLFKGINLSSPIHYPWIPIHYFAVFIRAIRILRKEKPTVLVTTGGSEVAVPVCYAGKLLKIKLVFIEAPTRVERPSLSGRLLAPISDRVFVRNPELLKVYGKKAEFHGRAV